MFWTVHNPLWHILSLSRGNLAGTTSSSIREEYSYMKANIFVLFSTKIFPFILISLSVVLKINIRNEKSALKISELIKLFGLNLFWNNHLFFRYLYMLHNCVNNCCIATTYKLITKIHICNIYTILCPERIGIFFTIHVPNLKRQCIWNILTSAPYKNWGAVDPTHGMGFSFGWELTRLGAIIHLEWFTSLLTCNFELWTFSLNSLRIIIKNASRNVSSLQTTPSFHILTKPSQNAAKSVSIYICLTVAYIL